MDTLLQFPFLARRPVAELQELHELAGKFLKQKEFTGANGLKVTDEMAVAIAAQACLPVLHLGLRWYDDFKGIVVHRGAMLARREVTDQAGVVHRYSEELAGRGHAGRARHPELAGRGRRGHAAEQGHNVVIHEFVHKMDMRDGAADGCPPLASRGAHASWHSVMQPAFDGFCEKVAMARRFGAEPPWLDEYGAGSPAEFFAVACEAYFVNRERFTQDFAPFDRAVR
jgi:Mlc titration factor MtfA (ptsG expression regulator)